MHSPLVYFFGFTIIMSALIMLSAFLSFFVRAQPMIERAHNKLVKARGITGNISASIVGMMTPFCSCTTVPVFAGLLTAGVETGTAMSFLIASPSVGAAAMVLLFVLFGYRTALAYTAASLIVAVLGGYILRFFYKEEPLQRTFMSLAEEAPMKTCQEALVSAWHILRYFLPVVLFCALLGTMIENYVPESLLASLTVHNSIWMIPVVVIIGAAIYADIIVLIPIGFALIEKGVNQGIVLAFMLAAAGISVPSVLLLSKVIKPKLLVYFIATLVLLYICLGIIFYFV